MNNEAKAYKLFVNQGFSGLSTFDVESVRIKNERLHAIINKPLNGKFNGSTKDELVQIDFTELPISIYTPINASKENIVIYFHGGGKATKSTWISVEYRLGPEHKFPIWLDDSVNVVRHIVANKVNYGGTTLTKIGVAGDSGGATIAASVCLTLKDSVEFQILIYGSFDLSNSGVVTTSDAEFNDDPFLSRSAQVKWVCSNAFIDPEAGVSNPRVSILRNEKSVFRNLPPTLFIVAEIDPARDDSYAYHKKLQEVGVKSELHSIKGVVHTFFSLPGVFRQACSEAVDVMRIFMETNLNI
ncbi:unnamed protein product [Rotaria magnacalcarata]